MKTTKKLEHRVLAHGEVTGHTHEATSGALFETDTPGVMMLDVPSGATIVHPEHKPVTVPPGQMEVHRVQEFDHFAEESRQVAD